MAGTGSELVLLTGIEGVRRRPGMYIGTTDDIAPLGWEVLGNALDEHLAGYAHHIAVSIDGARLTIEDDGRGIPFDRIVQVLTMVHAGTANPTPRKHRHVAENLVGLGCAITNALSRTLEVTVWRDGKTATQRFERGIAAGPMTITEPTTRTGTRITFEPDFTILKPQAWDVARITARCRELAALEPGVEIAVNGARFRYASLADFVREQRTVLVDVVHCDVLEDDVAVRAAFAWHDGAGAAMHFVNASPSGGHHVAAFDRAIERVFARRLGRRVSRRRMRRGMVAVLHVMLDNPRWKGPTKAWLENAEVAGVVERVVERDLERHLEATPALLDALLLRWDASAARGRARRSTARPRTTR